MSDNIPFDIQMQIIKKVYHAKSLIKFRSVSKTWKPFIDSSDFIKGYGARHTQPRSFILSYKVFDNKYICLADDDKETFKVQNELAPSVVSPLLKQFNVLDIVGTSHGLLCLYGYSKVYDKQMVVVWNPCIAKSFGIVVPSFYSKSRVVYGFGVCPITSDPTVVRVLCAVDTPCHVEVFTLSLGVWNVIPSDNLPRQNISLNPRTKIVTDRFIYWGAWEKTIDDDGKATINPRVMSFDLITKEFKVVNLPNSLTNKLSLDFSVSKLKGSLVVYGYIKVERVDCCGIWVMEHDSSFRKLFTIGASGTSVDKILWFKKNGETIFETRPEWGRYSTLNVYDPCSQQIKNLQISGVEGSFFMGSYKESLLLLDHPDLHIHSDHRMITTTFQALDLQS